jgi:cytochrome P450
LRLRGLRHSYIQSANHQLFMNATHSNGRLPPGPEDPCPVGVDPETLALLTSLRDRYGNFVAMRKPNGRQAYFINDADEVRRLLVRHHGRYVKGPGFERVKMLLGNGLIVSDGDTWRRSRRMIQPAFTRQNVHQLIGLMTQCALERVERWTEVALNTESLDITQEMSDFALELILRCIFGEDYDTSIVSAGENPFAFLSKESERNLRIVMQVRETRELILAIVNARRRHGNAGRFDFLAMYMDATDREGDGFSDEELLDEIVTLIVAGYETSAGTLNWAWYLLASNPEAEEDLLEEARGLVPDADEVKQDSLAEMVYAQQLLEETLRLYPPVWLFSRRAIESDRLAGFDVDVGTDIYLSPYILHRTTDYWPDPDRFDPRRFGPDAAYRKGDRPYFPFSLGPRRCLGEYFSFLEMKVHLGLLIQKFHMTLVADDPPELDLGINLRTKKSILLRPSLRR